MISFFPSYLLVFRQNKFYSTYCTKFANDWITRFVITFTTTMSIFVIFDRASINYEFIFTIFTNFGYFAAQTYNHFSLQSEAHNSTISSPGTLPSFHVTPSLEPIG